MGSRFRIAKKVLEFVGILNCSCVCKVFFLIIFSFVILDRVSDLLHSEVHYRPRRSSCLSQTTEVFSGVVIDSHGVLG